MTQLTHTLKRALLRHIKWLCDCAYSLGDSFFVGGGVVVSLSIKGSSSSINFIVFDTGIARV
jgi:hypothetical protein